MRRLPIYLLLDTSDSMAGEPLAAVETDVQIIVSALRQDPFALETVYLSVITFGGNAEQIVPQTELTAFQVPSIQASGATALGDALTLLANKIDSEVVKSTAEKKGDGRPLVFIFTDGNTDDDLQKGLIEFRKRQIAYSVVCKISEKAKFDIIKLISDEIISIDCFNEFVPKMFHSSTAPPYWMIAKGFFDNNK
jgi:uncharacterized protein YegL